MNLHKRMHLIVGRIIRMWADDVIPNSLMVLIQYDDHGSAVGDSIMTDNPEDVRNYLGKHVYIYRQEDVPNNLLIGVNNGARRTGRLVLNEDGTIRITNNNHIILGEEVDIDV